MKVATSTSITCPGETILYLSKPVLSLDGKNMDLDKSVDNDNDYDNINAHNQNSEIESMDLKPIKGSDKENNVIEIMMIMNK